MNLKIFLILFLALAMSGVPAGAEQYCYNSTHKYWQQTIYQWNGTGMVAMHRLNSSLEYCPNGCVKGECKMPFQEDDRTMAFAILFGILAFTFAYIGMNLPKDDWTSYLSWLFIPMALLMMIVGIFVILEYNAFADNLNMILAWSGYSIIIILIVLIAFLLISLLAYYLGLLSFGKKKEKPYSTKLKGDGHR